MSTIPIHSARREGAAAAHSGLAGLAVLGSAGLGLVEFRHPGFSLDLGCAGIVHAQICWWSLMLTCGSCLGIDSGPGRAGPRARSLTASGGLLVSQAILWVVLARGRDGVPLAVLATAVLAGLVWPMVFLLAARWIRGNVLLALAVGLFLVPWFLEVWGARVDPSMRGRIPGAVAKVLPVRLVATVLGRAGGGEVSRDRVAVEDEARAGARDLAVRAVDGRAVDGRSPVSGTFVLLDTAQEVDVFTPGGRVISSVPAGGGWAWVEGAPPLFRRVEGGGLVPVEGTRPRSEGWKTAGEEDGKWIRGGEGSEEGEAGKPSGEALALEAEMVTKRLRGALAAGGLETLRVDPLWFFGFGLLAIFSVVVLHPRPTQRRRIPSLPLAAATVLATAGLAAAPPPGLAAVRVRCDPVLVSGPGGRILASERVLVAKAMGRGEVDVVLPRGSPLPRPVRVDTGKPLRVSCPRDGSSRVFAELLPGEEIVLTWPGEPGAGDALGLEWRDGTLSHLAEPGIVLRDLRWIESGTVLARLARLSFSETWRPARAPERGGGDRVALSVGTVGLPMLVGRLGGLPPLSVSSRPGWFPGDAWWVGLLPVPASRFPAED